MAGTKRRALTTDDLMRSQEEPNRKRMRRTPSVVERSEDSESGSVSDEEAAGSSDESDEDGREAEAEKEERGEPRLEGDEDDIDSEDEALETDRFNLSRIAS